MKRYTKLCSLCVVSAFVQNIYASEVSLEGGLAIQAVTQTIDDKTLGNEIDSNNLIFRPFLTLAYEGRDLEILATATHNYIRRSLDDANVTNNFTNYNYAARYDIIPNLLNFRANGSQSFRSQAANSFLVDNFLLNAENLGKNNTNNAALTLNLPTGRYFGLNAQFGVNNLSSEFGENSQIANPNQRELSTDGYNGSLQLESGRDLRPFSYNLNGNIRGINRQNQQDFESQVLDLDLGLNVTSDFSLRLLGYYESNDIANTQSNDSGAQALREFYSYGAGIAWQPSQNRFIELGINRSITEGRLGEEDEEDDFISVNMRWNFSSRTSMNGNYSRRFFGDSGSFRFSHNLRNWRSNISYNESVTSNSQLLLAQDEGLLVCTNGSTDLSDCSLSDGLDPSDLGPNEVFVPFTINGFELNDRIILRKALTAQTAFDLRRTTLTASITDSTNEEVQAARQINTLAGRLAASINLSSRSSVIATLLYSNVERLFEGELQESVIKQATLTFEHKLTRRLVASIGYSFLDRSGDTFGNAGGIQGINGPLTDNRLSAEISYKFSNRR